MSAEPSKSTVDRLLDCGVFAPLGFLLDKEKAVSQLAVRGREQVAFSRSLGRAALKGMARSRQATAQSKPAQAARPTAPTKTTKATKAAETTTKAKAATPAKIETPDIVIDGYDDLTAREIVARVASLSPEQLRWLTKHETEQKARVTVLRAANARLSASA